jgi:hypothetical protein
MYNQVKLETHKEHVMSERMNKLAKQAWYQDLLERDPNWKPREGPGDDRFMRLMEGTFDKFAELIVRECISTLDGIEVLDSDSQMIAIEIVSAHFGLSK